ncbi:uncharacterized protein HD556DRAFT_1499730 [Suillus plorans]|uniref:Histone deacetylase domain-containing protein n=1 Tax=Suillus plorans TaxID=116603 RepID=A0A9P7AFC7_9AGAM|nr:uncharacterized protein HD556DRAFT_1499730 [Suillus plorans]KAG1788275.1 hypothetical protein HD556DRAFT_1499730 [Suillus plorans]
MIEAVFTVYTPILPTARRPSQKTVLSSSIHLFTHMDFWQHALVKSPNDSWLCDHGLLARRSSWVTILNLLEVSECGLEDDCPMFHGIKDYITLVAGVTLTGAAATRNDISDIAICWDGGRCSVTSFSQTRFHSCCSSSSPGFFPCFPLASLPDVDDPAFDPFTLSVPLKARAPNKTFLRIWPIIEHVKDIFRPDFIIVQCGLDGLAGDPMATLNWSLRLARLVHASHHPRMAREKMLLGGGGYDTPNAAQAWTYLTSVAVCLNLRFWFVIY